VKRPGMLTAAAALLLVSSSPAQDQPLGDVARQTREQTSHAKSPAKVFTNEETAGQALTPSDDPIEVVRKAAAAMLHDTSHRCRESATGNSGPGWSEVTVTEFAGTDRIRLVKEKGDNPGETIMIGNDGYRRVGSGPWAKIDPMEMTWYQTYAHDAIKLPDELKFGYNPGDLKLMGPETIAGTPTFHYRWSVLSPMIRRTIDIWVSVKDNLPQQTEMQSYDPTTKLQWHETTACTYGVAITIEPPR
jgi:hypothetical protein